MVSLSLAASAANDLSDWDGYSVGRLPLYCLMMNVSVIRAVITILLSVRGYCFIHIQRFSSLSNAMLWRWLTEQRPDVVRPWPAPLSICLSLFLAGCTASWEVGYSVPEWGTYFSSSPRQLTTGCSTAIPAITCIRVCGDTVCLGNAWHTQTALVRLPLYSLVCWWPYTLWDIAGIKWKNMKTMSLSSLFSQEIFNFSHQSKFNESNSCKSTV